MAATKRVAINVAFQYLNGSGYLIPVPTGTPVTIVDRNSGQPPIVYADLSSGATIANLATTAGGNVPGCVVEGSYTIAAQANVNASPPFAGAAVSWEAVRGDGVEFLAPNTVTASNIINGAVGLAQLAAAVVQSLVPTGTILSYGGLTAPTSFALCDGSIQNIGSVGSTYYNLYQIIGQNFRQPGDSYNTGTQFRMPNLVGRLALGKAASGAEATLGYVNGTLHHTHTIPQLSSNQWSLGSLTVNSAGIPQMEIPSHTHLLDGNGGAQLRASAVASQELAIMSGGTGPVFNASGAALGIWNSGTYGQAINTGQNQGNFSSYALLGSTGKVNSGGNNDGSGNMFTNAGYVTGQTTTQGVTIGAGAITVGNGTQQTGASDPPYQVVNHIIKL